MLLHLVATCALGLEELLAAELTALGVQKLEIGRGAVTFRGDGETVYRANWWLRTANRVLLSLARWPAPDGDALAEGARRLVLGDRQPGGMSPFDLFDPAASFSLRATTRGSTVQDTRWAALRVKDGIVDGQREKFGRRSNIDRDDPDRGFRLWLANDVATLFLDTSGLPLDRRGYRQKSIAAPLRETLAAACVLASEWSGEGVVVDPMCGSGTLLIEAANWAMGRAPGWRRSHWAFERLPVFERDLFEAVRREPAPGPMRDRRPVLYGLDVSGDAVEAARVNLDAADLGWEARIRRADAFRESFGGVAGGPGLVVVNPPYGERSSENPEQWKRLGDLLKQRFGGFRAAVIAGDAALGKHIGLKPSRRWPVRNGALEARILTFDLY